MTTILLIVIVLIVVAGIFATANTWAYSVAIAFDMFAGALATRGQLGMTISAWCEATYQRNKYAAALRRLLNKLQVNHCQRALLSDVRRAQSILQQYGHLVEQQS